MSSNLHWEPVKESNKTLDDYEIKKALRAFFGGTVDITVDESFGEVVRGWIAADVKGADKLLKIIEKHGKIKLWEQF